MEEEKLYRHSGMSDSPIANSAIAKQSFLSFAIVLSSNSLSFTLQLGSLFILDILLL